MNNHRKNINTPDPSKSNKNILPVLNKLDLIRDKVKSTIPKIINNIVKQNDQVINDVMNKI